MADFPDPAVLKEIMGLLSIPESRLEGDLISAVNRQYQRIKDASEPKSLFSVFEADVRDSHIIFDGAFSIIGKDLAYTCSGCKRAVLMAVTLGSRVDMLIRRSQSEDMSEAVIADACASAEADRIADMAEKELMASLSDEEFLTMRFSPGYGDLPLTVQRNFLTILDTSRKIGLTVTESFLMVPSKSVSAIIGISPTEIQTKQNPCDGCILRTTCELRKAGTPCWK